MRKYLFLITLLSVLLLPNISLAIDLNLEDYPEFGGLDLDEDQNLNQIVAWFYYFIVGIAGFAAFVMMIVGGFQYLTSAGNPAQISDAKDRILKALLGLLIILASWLILQVINPELIILTEPML